MMTETTGVSDLRLVRILKNWNWPNLFRQSPGERGIWGDVQLTLEPVEACDYAVVLNDVPERVEFACAPGNVWYLIQEPPVGRPKRFHRNPSFLTFTTDASRSGPNYIESQPALVWRVNRTYDFLRTCKPPEKPRRLSWVTSSTRELPGHRLRMQFLERAKRHLEFDLLGVGFQPIDDKWDGVAPYRYSLAVENHVSDDYWTEKISDCFLAWTMPIYYGARRIDRYFPAEAMIQVDIAQPGAIERIEDILRDDPWRRRLDAIAEARRLVLERYQLFPFLAAQIAGYEARQGSYLVKRRITLAPKHRLW